MTRKLWLVFVLLGFAAPKLAQPTVGDLSWPEARIWIEQVGTLFADAAGANDIGSRDDAIDISGTSAAGSDAWFSRFASRSLQENGHPQHANRVEIGGRVNARRKAGGVDSTNAQPDPSGARRAAATTLSGLTLVSADAIPGAAAEGELFALDADGANLSGADAFGAESLAACATGTVKGFGFDATTLKYETTCGNYGWSAESGGGSYATPTTAGGNSEYLTCSAPGVGQSDAGVVFNTETDLTSVLVADNSSTTFVLEQPSAGWIVNQWRDRLVRVTSGPAANDVRRIASNDEDTLALTADRPFTNAPGGGTYTIRDDLGSVCWAAGERVKLNYMADAMLAQDHTLPGGTVLFPNFAGYDHGIYVDRGCGRKGAGATAVSNSCPKLAAPLDEHLQRTLQSFSRIQWVGQGTDPDLAVGGRKNVWLVQDVGTQPGETNADVDPSDGSTAITAHGLKSGMQGYQARVCYPTSTTDHTCNADANTNSEVGDSAWGRGFVFANDEEMTDPDALCISDSLADSGTCRGDRRIPCTSTGARTGIVTGGCDFGAGGDIGPCESVADAIEYELAQKRPVHILTQSRLYDFPELSSPQVQMNSAFASVRSVPGGACGTGVAMSTMSWPFTVSKITAADDPKDFYVLDWDRWYNEGGGYTQITSTPNNYYGRDIDGDTVSDIGDCLSAADVDTADDEPGCDYQALVGLQSSYSGGFDTVVLGYSSNTFVDGSDSGIQVKLYNSLMTEGKRGNWIDASNWDLWNDTWLHNYGSGCFSVNFTHAGKIRDQKFINNECSTLINLQHGKGLWMDGLYMNGNRVTGNLLYLYHATDLRISNVVAEGNTGQFLTMLVRDDENMANFTLEHVNAYSRGHEGQWSKALIALTRFGNISGFNGSLRNFTFHDIHWETPESDTCLFYFDDAQGTDDQAINLNRTQFSISDSSIDGLNGATGHKAICATPMFTTVTNGQYTIDATTDLGIGTLRYQPTWRNVRANGVPLPDGPPMVAAASAGDCNAFSQGTLVKIYDDTSVGACTDAGANGILDGGGTTVSTCECNGAGAWRAGGAGDVVSTGVSLVGGIPTFSDSSGNAIVDSGTTIVDGILTLAPSTVRPNEIRYHEDADLGSNYLATQAVSTGTNLIGDARLILTRVSRALAAASGPRGPVVGAVSNGGTFDTPEGLCDLAYYSANGVIQSCIAGTAKQFDPNTAAPSWIDCHDTVASGSYFEVVCNVE